LRPHPTPAAIAALIQRRAVTEAVEPGETDLESEATLSISI